MSGDVSVTHLYKTRATAWRSFVVTTDLLGDGEEVTEEPEARVFDERKKEMIGFVAFF